jgi:hypothetical protein
MPIKNDLTGTVFGRWTVLEVAGRDKRGALNWKCLCSCGTTRSVFGANLTRGLSTSCGCYSREITAARTRTHGQIHTPLYKSWADMIGRTTSVNNSEFRNYGARGITVCPQWQASFEVFAEDMGPTYREGLTLERIDVDGPYTPENCTWATRKEQARNKRNTVRVEFQGVVKPLIEWCELLGLRYATVYYRIHRYGWSAERALITGADPGALARFADPAG